MPHEDAHAGKGVGARVSGARGKFPGEAGVRILACFRETGRGGGGGRRRGGVKEVRRVDVRPAAKFSCASAVRSQGSRHA